MDSGDRAGFIHSSRQLDKVGRQQRADGSMPQNTNLEGVPVWTGQQLDETADAVLLAVRL